MQAKKRATLRPLLVEYRGKRSQEEMGKLYNMAQQVWGRWELGQAKPSVVTMKRLGDDIGKPMEEIFFDVFNTQWVSSDNT